MRRLLVPATAALLLAAACSVSSSRTDAPSTTEPLTLAPTPAGAPYGAWSRTDPISTGPLTYVECFGPDDCYADGLRADPIESLVFVEHWDGREWTEVGGTIGSVPPHEPTAVGGIGCVDHGMCAVPVEGRDLQIWRATNPSWTSMPIDHPIRSAPIGATVTHGAATLNGSGP